MKCPGCKSNSYYLFVIVGLNSLPTGGFSRTLQIVYFDSHFSILTSTFVKLVFYLLRNSMTLFRKSYTMYFSQKLCPMFLGVGTSTFPFFAIKWQFLHLKFGNSKSVSTQVGSKSLYLQIGYASSGHSGSFLSENKIL